MSDHPWGDRELSSEERYFELLMNFAEGTADPDTLDRIERLLNIPAAPSHEGGAER